MSGYLRSIFVKIYIVVRKMLIGSGLEKFRIIKFINNFLLSRMKQNYVIILGNKMFLDKYDALELSLNKIYEPVETDLIESVVKPGDVVLDIGAHIGYYTLILSRLVGKTGKVFAFEPDIDNFNLLKKNVEINNCENVIISNMAITNKIGSIKLFRDNASSNSSIYSSSNDLNYNIVDCTSLDEYFKDFNMPINFIKMDIEGAEYSVFLGAKNLLNKNNDIKIITEFYPVALNKFNILCDDYINVLCVDYKFKLFKIDEVSNKIILILPSVLLEEYTVEKKNLTNLLCTR